MDWPKALRALPSQAPAKVRDLKSMFSAVTLGDFCSEREGQRLAETASLKQIRKPVYPGRCWVFLVPEFELEPTVCVFTAH